MSKETPRLMLYEADPVINANDLFDIDKLLNENWDKIDLAFSGLENGDIKTLKDEVQALEDRLDTETATDKGLAPGTTTVVSPKNSLYKVSSVSGRSLFNLLDRDGNCESLLPWTITGATGALDTANRVYGSNAIKLTLTQATGTASKQVPIVSGRKYVVVADLKVTNASNTKVYVTGLNGSLVTSTNSATSYLLFTASSTGNITVGVSTAGIAGQVSYMDGVRMYELSAADYATAGSLNSSGIAAKYPYSDGITGVLNPYVLRWTSPAKGTIAGMLAFQTELLADPVTGADPDIITPQLDGSYLKMSKWKRTVLNGSLPWTFNNNGASGSGLKRIGSPVSNNWIPFGVVNVYATKYDGSKLSPQSGNNATPLVKDAITLWNNGNLYIDIANSESGWGENYTPSADEVRAFMLGWKMYDSATNNADGLGTYNRTDGLNKAWTPLRSYNGSSYSGSTTTVPSVRPENSTLAHRVTSPVSPYKLVYMMSGAIAETVKTEGSITLLEGDNVIEVGSGLVIREKVTPYQDQTAWNINNGSPSSPGSEYALSLTKQRVEKFIGIYKNSAPDIWVIYPNTTTPAGALAQQNAAAYDIGSVYTVSYIPFDRYPTAQIQGSYTVSEKSTLKELMANNQTLTSRVSVLENVKLEKEQARVWITPTLLLGWGGAFGFGYCIENNRLYFRGSIREGSVSPGQLLFSIAEGYRSPRSFTGTVGSYTASSGSVVSIDFFSDGRVSLVNNTALPYISFEGFSYPLS